MDLRMSFPTRQRKGPRSIATFPEFVLPISSNLCVVQMRLLKGLRAQEPKGIRLRKSPKPVNISLRTLPLAERAGHTRNCLVSLPIQCIYTYQFCIWPTNDGMSKQRSVQRFLVCVESASSGRLAETLKTMQRLGFMTNDLQLKFSIPSLCEHRFVLVMARNHCVIVGVTCASGMVAPQCCPGWQSEQTAVDPMVRHDDCCVIFFQSVEQAGQMAG
eukprot:6478355-Amphidinium_carterae.2